MSPFYFFSCDLHHSWQQRREMKIYSNYTIFSSSSFRSFTNYKVSCQKKNTLYSSKHYNNQPTGFNLIDISKTEILFLLFSLRDFYKENRIFFGITPTPFEFKNKWISFLLSCFALIIARQSQCKLCGTCSLWSERLFPWLKVRVLHQKNTRKYPLYIVACHFIWNSWVERSICYYK